MGCVGARCVGSPCLVLLFVDVLCAGLLVLKLPRFGALRCLALRSITLRGRMCGVSCFVFAFASLYLSSPCVIWRCGTLLRVVSCRFSLGYSSSYRIALLGLGLIAYVLFRFGWFGDELRGSVLLLVRLFLRSPFRFALLCCVLRLLCFAKCGLALLRCWVMHFACCSHCKSALQKQSLAWFTNMVLAKFTV